MRRWLSLLLTFFLLLPACAGAERYDPDSIEEAWRQAVSLFSQCAFNAPYEDETRDQLIRWVDRIRIYLDGSPTKADIRQVDSFIMELSLRVPELPWIVRVESEEEANMVIHYCRLSEMESILPQYVEGNWGMYSYSYHPNGEIFKATICIARDKANQSARNHLIREEIVGALGLTNGHEVYQDSILYRKWTTVQTLSDVDWLMLNLLYSPHVFPGWNHDQTMQALESYYIKNPV